MLLVSSNIEDLNLFILPTILYQLCTISCRSLEVETFFLRIIDDVQNVHCKK